ncbi:hypothetical protein HDU76_009358 [Blyttiomyces sp. JEL0837]|nr:hypothetical protein HDU76_009358 [Blyttiomyces sp. JEL0837]
MSRQAFFASAGWKMRSAVSNIDALSGVGPAGTPPNPSTYDWRQDPFLDLNNSIYVNTRRMIHIRKSCEPLRRGNTYIRVANDYGLLAFSRIASYEAVMLMNVKRSGNYNVPSYSVYVDANMNADGAVFKNLFNPSQVAYARATANGGKVLDFGSGGFNLNQRGYALFVPAGVVGGYDNYLQATLCTH